MPEILHVNTDGHAPQIVFHSLGTRSWAEILFCYKSSDIDGVDMNFNSIFPFAVLSANEVKFLYTSNVNLDLFQILNA